MSQEANSMNAEWCAASLAPIRAHVNEPQADASRTQYRTWLIELLSQFDRPPLPDLVALHQAARHLIDPDGGSSSQRAASDPLWRAYRKLATPPAMLALLTRLAATQAERDTLRQEVAGHPRLLEMTHDSATWAMQEQLAEATARATKAESRADGLQAELAEQEREKLRLIEETYRWSEAEKRDKQAHQQEVDELKRKMEEGWNLLHYGVSALMSDDADGVVKCWETGAQVLYLPSHCDIRPDFAPLLDAPAPLPSSPAAAGPEVAVLSGQHYQHYKGTEYVVLCVAKKESDASQLEVVYSPVEVDETYTRPLAEFCAPRFVLLPGPRTSTLLVGEIEKGECHFDEDDLIEDPDWYPKEIFDSPAEYDASVASAMRRIESGEIQPIEPDEEEASATRFATIMQGVREINGKEKLLRKLQAAGVFNSQTSETPAAPTPTGEAAAGPLAAELLAAAHWNGWLAREMLASSDKAAELYPAGLDYEEKEEFAFAKWHEANIGPMPAAHRTAITELAAAPSQELVGKEGGLTGCHADRDGDCCAAGCPQLRDNEPHATGRFCPLPGWGDEEDD